MLTIENHSLLSTWTIHLSAMRVTSARLFIKLAFILTFFGIKSRPIEQFIRTVKMMEEHQYLTGDPFAEEVTRPSSSDISSELVIPSNKEDESTISSEEEKMPISSYEY